MDIEPLMTIIRPSIGPIFTLSSSLFRLQLPDDNAVGEKFLIMLQICNIYCSSLVLTASHFITEGNQVG